MPRLQWDNVQAPDFTPAMEGFRQASALLNNAFNSARSGLKEFETSRGAEAERALALAVQRYQSPEELQAAIQSGELFESIPQARLSTEAIQGLDRTVDSRYQRAGQVLQNEQTRGNIDWTAKERGWIEDRRTAQQALIPHMADITALAESGDIPGARQALANAVRSEGVGEGLTLEDFMGLNRGLSDARTTAQDIRGSDQQYRMGEFTYDQAVESEEEKDQADALWRDLRKNSIDGDGARQLLFTDPRYSNVSGAVFNTLMGRVDGLYGPENLGGSVSPTGSPGGGGTPGGADPTRIMNYEARAAGFNSLPDTVRTLGDASDYALQVNRAGVRSSAMGTYQIVGQTLRGRNNQNGYAERVFGANWRNVEWNQANQDKIAEAIFNDHKHSAAALRGQWVSLSPAEAERVRRMPWSQARQVIARGESGADLANMTTPDTSSRATIALAETAADENNPRVQGYVTAFGNRSTSLDDTVDAAIAGPLKGVDRRTVRNVVADLARQEDVSYSVAAWALSESVGRRGLSNLFSAGGDNGAIDVREARGLLREAETGGWARRTQLTVSREATVQQQQQARVAYQQAEAELQQATRLWEQRGRPAGLLDPYIRRRNDAQAALAALNIAATAGAQDQPGAQARPVAVAPAAPRRPSPIRNTSGGGVMPRANRPADWR